MPRVAFYVWFHEQSDDTFNAVFKCLYIDWANLCSANVAPLDPYYLRECSSGQIELKVDVLIMELKDVGMV
jgi:hypothetical protein